MILVREANVVVPVTHIVFIILTLSVCLLFRCNSAGLLIAYVYSFFLGWKFCQSDLMTKSDQYQSYVVVYFVFGGIVLLLTIVSMFLIQTEE